MTDTPAEHSPLARATGEGGELFLVLVLTLGGLWRMRGKLAEAGELLDGGIEAARLLGNTHALVWSLGSRSAAALHAGDVALALAAAQEAVELSGDLDAGFHSAEAAVNLARALLETGEPQRAVDLLVGLAGGEELVLIAGGPRAHYLDRSRSAGLHWTAQPMRDAQPTLLGLGLLAAAPDGDRLGRTERRRRSTSTQGMLGGGRKGVLAVAGRRRWERRSR